MLIWSFKLPEKNREEMNIPDYHLEMLLEMVKETNKQKIFW